MPDGHRSDLVRAVGTGDSDPMVSILRVDGATTSGDVHAVASEPTFELEGCGHA